MDMTMETYATLMIILLCWAILLVADLVVSGLLRLVAKVPFRKAFRWGLVALLVPPMVIAYGTLVERNRFEVKEVVLEFDDLPESFDGYRIVHISDIHARSFSKRAKQMQKAVDMINGTDPDLVAFTGDLITLVPEELDCIAPALSAIKAQDGVISVLGNHDYCMYSDLPSEAKEKHLEELIAREISLGWTVLMDENRFIRKGNDSIAVIGVQNISASVHFPSKGDLTKATEGTEGAFRIVLTHDPLHWESEILGQDYPLTLSGHTHAMQLSLFGWSPSSLMFKHNKGLYTSDSGTQSLYVNVGLGETIFPARIGARPEITLITLKKRAQN
jgi:predicted MPP superfamily phosphohydrolase